MDGTFSPALDARIRLGPRGRVEVEVPHERHRVGNAANGWRTLTRRELLDLDADGPEWTWLRSQGIRRPSPSGPSGPMSPHAQRGTRRRELSLTPEVDDALTELSRGSTRSAVVSELVMRATRGRA